MKKNIIMTLENEELIQLKGGEQMCDDEVGGDHNTNTWRDCNCFFNNHSALDNNNYVTGCKCICN